MEQSILVTYPLNNSPELEVFYKFERADDIDMIVCRIPIKGVPSWLQLRNFTLLSQVSDSGYCPLFNEINNSRNVDTALFIDQVYADIMKVR